MSISSTVEDRMNSIIENQLKVDPVGGAIQVLGFPNLLEGQAKFCWSRKGICAIVDETDIQEWDKVILIEVGPDRHVWNDDISRIIGMLDTLEFTWIPNEGYWHIPISLLRGQGST